MRYLWQLTEVAFEGWKDLFEDHVIAEAAVDRLYNPSEVITLKGESFRECSSKETIEVIKVRFSVIDISSYSQRLLQ